MRPSFIRLVVVICFLCSFFSAFSQVTLFGDVYIAPKNEIHILSGKLFFESGKIITDRGNNAGILSFAKGGSWERANHDTHVDGFIRFYEASAFTFPVGHDNILLPLRISNFSGSDHFDLAYQHRGHDVTSAPNGIAGVSDTHYWELRNPGGKGQVMLSWNTFSNITKLLGSVPQPENAIHLVVIGGFDGSQWQPIESELSEFSFNGDEVNSLLSGYIQSKAPVDLSVYKAFTLMMRNIPAIDSEKISQAITPNGDGKNDTWIIQGIEQYPQAHISVYNRWGEAVFISANGYKNDWAGNYKKNEDLLPSAPYLYVIDYDNDGRIDHKGWIYISD